MPKSFSVGMRRFLFTCVGAVCLALVWPVTAIGVGFAASVSLFPVGNGPVSVVVADFNGDGKADLAIANNGSNNVTVLLGDGNGGFTAATGSPFPAGNGPASLAVADFNGDGKADLAVVNSTSNGLVLLGNGSGGFTAAGSPFAAGTSPQSVAVGDFNGDGKADLVVANFFGFSVTVLLGNGGFTSASGSPFSAGSFPASVVMGDFNGDGKADLAVADFFGFSVTVLLGNGNGGGTAASGSPFAAGPVRSRWRWGISTGTGRRTWRSPIRTATT
jgi:FG-GAP-like repeat/FG-GAP repeat